MFTEGEQTIDLSILLLHYLDVISDNLFTSVFILYDAQKLIII